MYGTTDHLDEGMVVLAVTDFSKFKLKNDRVLCGAQTASAENRSQHVQNCNNKPTSTPTNHDQPNTFFGGSQSQHSARNGLPRTSRIQFNSFAIECTIPSFSF
jgi:hypothetical protein